MVIDQVRNDLILPLDKVIAGGRAEEVTKRVERGELLKRHRVISIIAGIGKAGMSADYQDARKLLEETWEKYAAGDGEGGGVLLAVGGVLGIEDQSILLNPGSDKREILGQVHMLARAMFNGKEDWEKYKFAKYLNESIAVFGRNDKSHADAVLEYFGINAETYSAQDTRLQTEYLAKNMRNIIRGKVEFDGVWHDVDSFKKAKIVVGLIEGEGKMVIAQSTFEMKVMLMLINMQKAESPAADRDEILRWIANFISESQYFSKRQPSQFDDPDKYMPKHGLGADHGTNAVVINRLMKKGVIRSIEYMPGIEVNDQVELTDAGMEMKLRLKRQIDPQTQEDTILVGSVKLVLTDSQNFDITRAIPANEKQLNELLEDLKNTKDYHLDMMVD